MAESPDTHVSHVRLSCQTNRSFLPAKIGERRRLAEYARSQKDNPYKSVLVGTQPLAGLDLCVHNLAEPTCLRYAGCGASARLSKGAVS